VRGVFQVTCGEGHIITPRKRKERGLLALIAMSPQKRRSRDWIKAKLWSDRDGIQAAGSLRRALCDLRRDLGDAAQGLCSDRNDVWFDDTIVVLDDPSLSGKCDLLETLDVPDPEFEDWLLEIRQADTNVTQPSSAPPVAAKGPSTLVLVSMQTQSGNPEDIFLTSFLTDTFSSRLTAESSVEVLVGVEPNCKRLADAETVLRLEFASIVSHGKWTVHLRAFADRTRRFIWSGRLTLPMDFRAICEGPDVAAFASKSLTNIRLKYQSYKLANKSHYVMLQRATQRLFSSDPEQFALAEAELIDVSTQDAAGIPLAWRAFGKMTQVIELGLDPLNYVDETRALLADALLKSPGNPLVLGLSAHIELKLSGDIDRGMFFARDGLHSCDQNPYAMLAVSQAYIHSNDFAKAHDAALLGQRMAEGLPNAFFWNMQACLTALSVSDFENARAAGLKAQAQNPIYRPALRYLAALSLLENDSESAESFAKKLRVPEPRFDLADLSEPDYPMHTLRLLGLTEMLNI